MARGTWLSKFWHSSSLRDKQKLSASQKVEQPSDLQSFGTAAIFEARSFQCILVRWDIFVVLGFKLTSFLPVD